MGRPFQSFSQDNADAQDAACEQAVDSWKARLLECSIPVTADVEQFLKWYFSQQRIAYKMEVQPVHAPLDVTASKVGGLPFLLPGEAWPTSQAGDELTFVWQFRIEELPQAAQHVLQCQHGLFQFFLDEELADEEGYYLARVLQTNQLNESGNSQPSSARMLPEKSVVGWTSVVDWPHAEDAIDMYNGTVDTSTLYDILQELDHLASNAAGDKLLGWPHWCQGPEWATTVGAPPASWSPPASEFAPGPNTRYTQFLQLECEHEDGMMIGDSGTLVIQCHPTLPAEFKVSWACC